MVKIIIQLGRLDKRNMKNNKEKSKDNKKNIRDTEELWKKREEWEKISFRTLLLKDCIIVFLIKDILKTQMPSTDLKTRKRDKITKMNLKSLESLSLKWILRLLLKKKEKWLAFMLNYKRNIWEKKLRLRNLKKLESLKMLNINKLLE